MPWEDMPVETLIDHLATGSQEAAIELVRRLEQGDQVVAAELVGRFRQGDQDAAAVLYNHFARKALLHVRRKLWAGPHRGRFDSEGIQQYAMKSFLSELKKPSLDPERSNLMGLLFRIVHRKCLVELRRRDDEINADAHKLALMEAVVTANADRHSREEAERRLAQIIQEVLSTFSEKRQRVLELWLDALDERTVDEIAAICGRSVGFVIDAIESFQRQLTDRVGQQLDDNPSDAPNN
jgi:DNA-directed RNA polymerase specialized sigma24 family protein